MSQPIEALRDLVKDIAIVDQLIQSVPTLWPKLRAFNLPDAKLELNAEISRLQVPSNQLSDVADAVYKLCKEIDLAGERLQYRSSC